MNNQVISLDLGDIYLYISLNEHLLTKDKFKIQSWIFCISIKVQQNIKNKKTN